MSVNWERMRNGNSQITPEPDNPGTTEAEQASLAALKAKVTELGGPGAANTLGIGKVLPRLRFAKWLVAKGGLNPGS